MSPQLATSATLSTLAMAVLAVAMCLTAPATPEPRPATAQGSVISVLLGS